MHPEELDRELDCELDRELDCELDRELDCELDLGLDRAPHRKDLPDACEDHDARFAFVGSEPASAATASCTKPSSAWRRPPSGRQTRTETIARAPAGQLQLWRVAPTLQP